MFAKVDRSLSLFISSKVDARYSPLRGAIKDELEHSGVFNVFAFECGSASSNTPYEYFKHHLSESDVVLFLLFDKKDLTIPVFAELDLAIKQNKKRLFLFDSRINVSHDFNKSFIKNIKQQLDKNENGQLDNFKNLYNKIEDLIKDFSLGINSVYKPCKPEEFYQTIINYLFNELVDSYRELQANREDKKQKSAP
jgi:hypothetical protein